MEKAVLKVTRGIGEIPVEGQCTACPSVRFQLDKLSLSPTVEDAMSRLERMFQSHFEEAHAPKVP